MQKVMNVPIEELDPEEVKEIVPAVNIEDIVLGAICRTDGVIDPHAVMQAYARGAKQRGAEINERSRAT
ncbi:FAD-binding oxidoreductase, partial [Klebsiella pneumoniae]|nr:FAD-binding oxidoreductase [Klebsiella pneumoniae]